MKHLFKFTTLLLISISPVLYICAAHAARIINMDDTPHSFKVKTTEGEKTITLQPKATYFTGPTNATVTSEDGKMLDLKANQKSVIREGSPLLWRGHRSYGNNRPEGVQQ